jgi:O-antigen ligase
MAVYRSQAAWEAYPTPGFNRQAAVHAHNELLHIGTDLGVPGMIVLVALYAMAGYMLWVVYRTHEPELQGDVVAITAGLVAHLIYGLADAIPLWDRFAYLFWLMLALCAMLYTHVRLEPQLSAAERAR